MGPLRVVERSNAPETVYSEYIAETEASAEPGQQTLDTEYASGSDESAATDSHQSTLENEDLLEQPTSKRSKRSTSERRPMLSTSFCR